MDEILKYFTLTELQREQMEALGPLYRDWNEKINVISRKDIDNLYLHHILHSLAPVKFMTPKPGTTFLDMGTGGGFPGIPLAIMWSNCKFHLIDRIGKKIKVASSIAESIGLKNVTFQHGDMGECHETFNYVLSRAVMSMPELISIVRRSVSRNNNGNSFPGGLLCLKGGDLSSELSTVKRPMIEVPLSDYFSEDYYKTKSLIYVEL